MNHLLVTPRRLRQQVTSLAPYILIPALSAAAPLLVIPAISARFGAATWTSIAIGQSLGAAAAVIAELGWGVNGPQRVAATSPSRRYIHFRSALSSKLVACMVLVPIVILVTVALAPSSRWEAAEVATGTTLYALSTGWFFIGAGTPRFILYSDSIPRVSVTIACALAIFAGAPLWLYTWSTIVLPIVFVGLSCRILGRCSIPQLRDFKRTPRAMKKQGVLALGRMVSTAYTALPISIVAAAAPSAVTVYAGSDRLMRMGLTFLAAFPNRLQSWVGSSETRAIRLARSRRSLVLNAALGAVTGTLFAALAPLVAQMLYAGTIQIPYLVSGASGLLLAIICTSRGFGLSVVALGRANSITVAVILAATTGLSLLAPLVGALGPAGAVLAIVAAEAVGVIVQAWVLRRALSSQGGAASTAVGEVGN